MPDPRRPGSRIPGAGTEAGPFERDRRGSGSPLAGALNTLNRSMGEPDLYPFVLAPTVIDKLAYVDRLVRAERADGTTGADLSDRHPGGRHRG